MFAGLTSLTRSWQLGIFQLGFTAGHSAVDLLVFEFSLRLGVMAQQKKEEKSYVENHHQKVDQGAAAQD